jgi:predicted acylesterase/phospholipase RssA
VLGEGGLKMAEEAGEYCDLVMKGGVTSGIVYPNAVLALAGRYRFKNIGGTSAGAIAAAAAAAAALGERRKALKPAELRGSAEAAGFGGLEAVARDLSRQGFIHGLFQPARGAGAAYGLAETLSRRPGMVRSGLAAVRAVILIAPLETLAIMALLLLAPILVGGPAGLAAAFLPALLCALAVGAGAALFRVGRVLRTNFFGLCPGLRPAGTRTGPPALTEWLHEVVQSLAGQDPGQPLTLGQLWEAPRYENEPGKNAITLQMITTGVSHHEPQTLPFTKSPFWFLREDFDRLFPKAVVDSMAAADPAPVAVDGRLYYRLPEQGALPVLVATRMSLSFPILLSAVPLYEEEFHPRGSEPEADPEERPGRFRRCWFSDGGIGSNFPIHMFDSALPRWPTFAINLVYPKTAADVSAKDEAPAEVEAPYLRTENNKGWRRRHYGFESPRAIGEVIGFLFAIVGTMQNWRDLLQSRAPGHRDRIVHVPLGPGEGGLNLDMKQAVLDSIAEKGRQAGTELAAKFDFNNHYWVRWRNAASGLERFTIALAGGARPPLTPSYAAAHARMWTGKPAAGSYRFRTAAQAREAEARLKEWSRQGENWHESRVNLTDGAPRPLPEMHIIPTF